MKEYLRVMQAVLENGTMSSNRTGTGTLNTFVENFRHDLRDGFPLLTTKKINPKQVFGELFAFLNGETTLEGFQRFGCNIWNDWGLKKNYVKLIEPELDVILTRISETTGQSVDEITTYLESEAARTEAYNLKRTELLARIEKENIGIDESTGLLSELELTRPDTLHSYARKHQVSMLLQTPIYDAGYLGPIYGKQWLAWKTSTGREINQIMRVATQLTHTPQSRRIIFTGWNPEHVPNDHYATNPISGNAVTNSDENVQASICDGKQALPPCHLMTILNTSVDDDNNTVVSMHVIMRSTDVPLGLPFNIASYAALLMMIAKKHGFIAGELVITMTNCHIYIDQLDGVKEQLQRTPDTLPTLTIPDSIDYTKPETMTPESLDALIAGLKDYNPQAFIKFPRAV